MNLQELAVGDLLQQRLNNLRGVPNPNLSACPEEVPFLQIMSQISIFLLKHLVLIHTKELTQDLQGELEMIFLGLKLQL